MTESEWVAVASGLPADGQVVLVKAKLGAVERRAQFFAKPVPRWQGEEFISGVNMYAYWRPLPTLD